MESLQKIAAQKKVVGNAVRVVGGTGLKIAVGMFLFLLATGLVRKGYDAYRTPDAVARIHARTVTMDMVEGKNLPPMPDALVAHATVAGVDSNNNGVRDDVEIEIYNRHKDSPKIRAAQLQYAMMLQSNITDVFSEKTLVAVLKESGRAYICMNSLFEERTDGLPLDKPIYEWSEDEMELGNKYSKEKDAIIDPLIAEIKALVLNTSARQEQYQYVYRYMTSYGDSDKPEHCDIFNED